MIKKAATDLGVGDLYPLLAAMVTRKRFDDIMDENEKSYNKRLRYNNTQEDKERMQTFAKRYAREIVTVLHDINKYKIFLEKL